MSAKKKASLIGISATGFNPVVASACVGEVVTWKNNDSVPHAVTIDLPTPVAASPDIAPGDTYEHTFDAAGAVEYHCEKCPEMRGTITVS